MLCRQRAIVCLRYQSTRAIGIQEWPVGMLKKTRPALHGHPIDNNLAIKLDERAQSEVRHIAITVSQRQNSVTGVVLFQLILGKQLIERVKNNRDHVLLHCASLTHLKVAHDLNAEIANTLPFDLVEPPTGSRCDLIHQIIQYDYLVTVSPLKTQARLSTSRT